MKARGTSIVVVTAALLLSTAVRNGTLSADPQNPGQDGAVVAGISIHHDMSPPLRDMKQAKVGIKPEHEANENAKIPHKHKDAPDPVVQGADQVNLANVSMPSPASSFDGVPFPGVGCNCAPPDTNGEVGATQYVQIVNEGFQVFDKSTG